MIGLVPSKVVTTGALFLSCALSWPIFLSFIGGGAESYVVPLMSGVTHFAYRKGLDFQLPVDGYPILYMAGWK